MKYAIVSLGIVAAGLAASINKHASSELRHSYGKAVLDSRDLSILAPRGTSESNRKATPSGGPSGHPAPVSQDVRILTSPSLYRSNHRTTSTGGPSTPSTTNFQDLAILTPRGTDGSGRKSTSRGGPSNRPVTKVDPDTSLPVSDDKPRSQTTSSGKAPRTGPRANTLQRATPSMGTSGATRPESRQLMESYLHQEQGRQQSPGRYQPPSRNRAPHLLNIIDNNSNRNFQQGWTPSHGHHTQPVGWGGLPNHPEHSIHQQLYESSRRDHLLNLVQNVAHQNIQQHQAEQHEKNRQRVGWGGKPIPRPADADAKAPDKLLGKGGFPNLLVHSSRTGNAPHPKTGINPNPRVERRNVSQNRVSLSAATLKRRGEINSHRISSSSLSSLSSVSSSSSSPEQQHQANNSVTRITKPQVGGPSGRTIRRRPTIAERLRWVGKPSQVPINTLRVATQRATTQRARLEAQANHSSNTLATTNSEHSSQITQWPATPHPALAFLPASIEGSTVSPGSSRSNSPRRNFFMSSKPVTESIQRANSF